MQVGDGPRILVFHPHGLIAAHYNLQDEDNYLSRDWTVGTSLFM
jgi:hypothetical protein